MAGKKEKYLTRFQVPREGLFDMVVQEPEDNRRCRKIFDDFDDFKSVVSQPFCPFGILA